jgi:hypothetical protein
MMAATMIGLTGLETQAQPAELLPLLPTWDTVFTARGGAGYKDNVFLSHDAPQRSAFLSGEGEVMVLHLPLDGPQFTFFGNAQVDHFLAVSHTEYTVFAQARLEQEFTEGRNGSLSAQYFHQDQVLDLSLTETNREATEVRGHMLVLEPGARLDLAGSFWLSLDATGTRQLYAETLDDYWEVGPRFTLGRDYGPSSSASFSYAPSWRFYDSDEARAADGTPIPGTQRQRLQHDAKLTWRHHWDETKHWRSTIALGGRLNEENGGGYSDYTRWSAAAQLQYRTKAWEAAVEGRVAQYDYSTQTVSATDPDLRRRTDWTVSFRVERELTPHLRVSGSFEHERTRSNDVGGL